MTEEEMEISRSTPSLRVIAETRYLDDVDDLLPKNSTARDFFNAMLQRYPNRRLGATTLWAGTSTLYASRDRHGGEVFHDSIAVGSNELRDWGRSRAPRG
jgi:hypothetical protein